MRFEQDEVSNLESQEIIQISIKMVRINSNPLFSRVGMTLVFCYLFFIFYFLKKAFYQGPAPDLLVDSRNIWDCDSDEGTPPNEADPLFLQVFFFVWKLLLFASSVFNKPRFFF